LLGPYSSRIPTGRRTTGTTEFSVQQQEFTEGTWYISLRMMRSVLHIVAREIVETEILIRIETPITYIGFGPPTRFDSKQTEIARKLEGF